MTIYSKYNSETWKEGGKLGAQFTPKPTSLTPEEDDWIAESVAKNPNRFGNPVAKELPQLTPEEEEWIAYKHGSDTGKFSKITEKLVGERPEDDDNPDDLIDQMAK